MEDCAIHLWLVCLESPPCGPGRLDAVLSEQERIRADRFLRPQDARHFRVARATLRLLLGAYSGVDPASLRIDTGIAGKPFLEEDSGFGRWEFNLSHSGGWALIGVTRLGPIGVDLEAMRALPEHRELARQNFAPGEVSALDALSPADRLAGFYRCWTRKEAVVKALGVGMSMPLDRFEVSATSERRSSVTFDGSTQRFQLWSLEPLPGFLAALVLHGHAKSRARVDTFQAVSPHERASCNGMT